MLLSFVIPCYRSALTIGEVVEDIAATVADRHSYSYEVILVNDSSPDNTWDVIKNIAQKNNNVMAINLSKNFGQHAAIMAGLNHVSGDIVVCLDDDGQTPPNQLFSLVDNLGQYDVAMATYETKKHSSFRNFGSWVNEVMARSLLGKPKDIKLSSYFAMKRYIADEITNYKNSYPNLAGLILRATRSIINVSIDHKEREVGESGYTISKLLGLWMNGFTAFSVKPLRVASLCGAIFAGLGFLYGIYVVINRIMNPYVPLGFSATMVVMLVIGGLILLVLGMIGEYIGRIYISISQAPQFIIREVVNNARQESLELEHTTKLAR